MKTPVYLSALLLSSAVLLGGCSEPASETQTNQEAPPQESELPAGKLITGSVVHRANTALQTDSQVVLELRDGAEDAEGAEAVLADQRVRIDSGQMPINFTWEVAKKTLQPDGEYVFRAYINEGGRTTWISEPLRIKANSEPLDLGELVLQPYRSAGLANVLHCGRLQINVAYEGERLMLDAAGSKRELLPVKAASGARFEAEGDPDTHFWSKGSQASLTLDGQEYPLCAVPGDIIEPFKATGNEPFWHLEMDGQELTMRRLGDDTVFSASYTQTAENSSRRRVEATQGDEVLQATMTEQTCRDTMSDMIFPQRVEVLFAGEELKGCGGQPERLLQGAQWVVEDINAGGIIDRSRVTLNFLVDGRLTGMASCNNFTAGYELSGEGLSLTEAATTRKACAPSLMEQEQKVLEVLAAVQRFDITDEGALILYGGADQSLTARLQ
ncbi:MAG: META domain-containing protein [Pseudomonas sp.]